MQAENRPKPKKKALQHWQVISLCMAVYDLAAVCASYFLALWLRYDGVFDRRGRMFLNRYAGFILPYAICCLIIFVFFRMYNSMWRYASVSDMGRVLLASALTSALHAGAMVLFVGRMPTSYYLIGAGLQFILLAMVRFAYRIVSNMRKNRRNKRKEDAGSRVMLIGAGSAGQLILKDMTQAREVRYKVVCIIDDNPNKWHRYMDGVPIVGGRDEIMRAAQEYDVSEIFLAIPGASMQQKRDILAICSETGCKLKQLPGMYQLVNGDVAVSDMRDVSIEDLLGRDPIQTDMREVFEFITGKTVMVTGGGGSIGSELCRQIAAHNPKQLIIFDIYENNAYSIQLELKDRYPELALETLIGSVRDSRRIFEVFEKYRPQIVYHAAAHKHVPLMEDSPCEAIKNNAIGTYKTAYAAMIHGCERFVLISTDKAVHPTNIMGASKRLCEMIIQSFDMKIKAGRAKDLPQIFTHEGMENADKDGTGKIYEGIRTELVAVRFGNVLGSNGSVIPIFKKQIERGGPVTVTHPEIIRYFMTIPEAVSLVMLAGTYARGGEIFVLDMGSPVRIVDLARNLIRLSGFKPDIDIKIEYTGLRPGEKLYEEKLMAEEGLQKTDNELIHIGNPVPFDEDTFLAKLQSLNEAAYANREEQIRALTEEIVTTYHPAEMNRKTKEQEKDRP